MFVLVAHWFWFWVNAHILLVVFLSFALGIAPAKGERVSAQKHKPLTAHCATQIVDICDRSVILYIITFVASSFTAR